MLDYSVEISTFFMGPLSPSASSNRGQQGCSGRGQDDSTDRPIPDPPEDVFLVSGLVRGLTEAWIAGSATCPAAGGGFGRSRDCGDPS